MTHVVFWPNAHGLWEDRVTLFEQAFPKSENIWMSDFKQFHFDEFGHAPNFDHLGAVVIINGAVATDGMNVLNDQIRHFKWVLLASIGDEGSGQHLEWIQHPNCSIWVQDPKPGKHDRYHRLPSYSLPQIAQYVPKFGIEKSIDWFFSGSKRGRRWFDAIHNLNRDNCSLYDTHLGNEEYALSLARSKVVPCRPTFATPETCRVYDALEFGCVPIVGMTPSENICEHCDREDNHPHEHHWWRGSGINWLQYWSYIFGENPPFPVVESYHDLAAAMNKVLADWNEDTPKLMQNWWFKQKQRLIQ